MAGAAGYRIQEAWASIDTAFRMMVIHKLERSAKADMEAEDAMILAESWLNLHLARSG